MKFITKTLSSLLLLSQVFHFSNAKMIYSCTEKNTIALTFDDGPFKYTSELVDLLKENNISATFFINVVNYWKDLETNTEEQAVIKKAHDNGNQIASHTYRHNIPEDNDEFIEMMSKTNEWINSVIGERPAYFRAPRGECDSECQDQLDSMGYETIQWDTDTNDWDVSNGVEDRVERAKSFLTEEWGYKRDSYLVLMHDVQEHTVHQIVPWIVKNKPAGYRFVTVAECLGKKDSMYFQSETNKTVTTSTATSTPTGTIIEDNNTHNLIADDDKNGAVSNISFLWIATIVSILLTMRTYL